MVGKKLAHYLVQEKVGVGGMATVYKGLDLRLGKTVALKVIAPEVTAHGKEVAERFLREARAVASIEHANILPVHFIGAQGDHLFIAMQYADGGTLEGLVRRQGLLGTKETVRIVRDVALALCAAHAKNITHRDIKPSNIMLTRDDRVLVADFGLAKMGGARTTLTGSGYIMGTPAYMSPEQSNAQAVDGRSDLYSLGVMFYELVTGTLPYHGDNPLVIINQHVNAPVPNAKAARPDLDENTCKIIMRLMAKRPEDRYQKAANLVQDVNTVLGLPKGAGLENLDVSTVITPPGGTQASEEPALSPRATMMRKARKKTPVMAYVVSLVSALAVVGFLLLYLLPKWHAAQKAQEPVVEKRYLYKGKEYTAEEMKAMGVDLKAAGFGAPKGLAHPPVADVPGSGTVKTDTALTPTAPRAETAEPAKPPATPETPTTQGHEAHAPAAVAPRLEALTPKPNYDDVYVAAAATGDKIPHPLSKKTYPIIYEGQKIDVPEGMVFVPAGPFIMGDDQVPIASPAHRVDVKAFFMGKYEVTNAEYMEFVKATGHRMPDHVAKNGGEMPKGRENHPVTNVSWEDVTAYCEWCAKRLPTETEWEKAASWDLQNRRKYKNPWGDDPEDPEHPLANSAIQWGYVQGKDLNQWRTEFKENDKGKGLIALGGATTPVGSFAGGISYFNCYDMAGNAWEWVNDWFDVFPGNKGATPLDTKFCGQTRRVLRGGSWLAPSSTYAVVRGHDRPSGCYAWNGFRCAADYPWKPAAAQPAPAVAVAPQPQAEPSIPNYDDVYVAAAATGEKIPHPLSRKATPIIYEDQRIDVPEGMVFVPGGPFIMGEDGDTVADPAHKVDVKPFFIDKYEVTNAQYMEFPKAEGYSIPYHIPAYIMKNRGVIPEGRENHPVTYVSWAAAKAYCDWCGKRLPTEAEWEKAASWDITQKRRNKYPWGNNDDEDPKQPLASWGARLGFEKGGDSRKWTEEFLNSEKGKALVELGGGTMPVGSFKEGISPYTCHDMAGNVKEWCEDWFERYPGNVTMLGAMVEKTGHKTHVIRGSAWLDCYRYSWTNRCVNRTAGTSAGYYVGFRCAADYPWKPAIAEPERAVAVVPQPQAEPSIPNYDDVYVATAATGEKIPHPLSRKATPIICEGRRIDVPEGMIYVPAGKFIMGQGLTEREVYLDAYFMGKYEVTNAEWKTFVDATGFTPLPAHWRGSMIPEGREKYPVVNVSWEDTQKYCEWVSQRTGREVRLPTEAQWEMAASWDPKKRVKHLYPWGDQWDANLCNSSWALERWGFMPSPEGDSWADRFKEWSKSERANEIRLLGGNTTPVGSFAQGRSACGCYDMAGNAWEWCSDWFMRGYTSLKDAGRNPQGPSEEQADVVDFTGKAQKVRVVRGGAWNFPSTVCGSAVRYRRAPSYRSENNLGFRVVCSVTKPEAAAGVAAVAGPQVPAAGAVGTPAVDLISYAQDMREADERIDASDYAGARAFANGLKAKCPELVTIMLANVDRIESLRKRCFERVNSGAVKVTMQDLSKRYAYAGEIRKVDGKGVTAGITKPWGSFTKIEIANFYLKAADAKTADDLLSVAAFLMEGAGGEQEYKLSADMLKQAAGLGADVSALQKYLETRKRARQEYAEALRRGSELGTGAGEKQKAKGARQETTETAKIGAQKPTPGKIEGAAKEEDKRAGERPRAGPETAEAEAQAKAKGEEQKVAEKEEKAGGGEAPKAEGGAAPKGKAETEEKTKSDSQKAEGEKEKAPPEPEKPAAKSYDGEYVTTAVTRDKIPHPLSRKTYTIRRTGKRIEVPENMVFVPAGEFFMGRDLSRHAVWLDSFFIAKYEVTNAEWKAFINATDFLPLPLHWKAGVIPEGKENHPVVFVSCESAQKYCEWVSKQTGLDACLPAEAQWEKTAAGPNEYEYPWGNAWDSHLCNAGRQLGKFGLRLDSGVDASDDWDREMQRWQKTKEGVEILRLGGNTKPVGSYPRGKSGYGCYDMAGNVSEWCSDWYKSDYYTLKDANKNPHGPSEDEADFVRSSSGSKSRARVLRGGGWEDSAQCCRTVHRVLGNPRGLYFGVGFRIVVIPKRN